ncbi:MAG: hypothetical protein R2911_31205 [Caldilineaceae bacterium]
MPHGRGDIAVGNVVGSNIFNLGIILGVVALVRSITVSHSMVRRDGGEVGGAGATLLFFLRDLTPSLGRLYAGRPAGPLF